MLHAVDPTMGNAIETPNELDVSPGVKLETFTQRDVPEAYAICLENPQP